MEAKERNQPKLPIFANSSFFVAFFVLGYLTCLLEAISVPVKIIIMVCVVYVATLVTKLIFRREGIGKGKTT